MGKKVVFLARKKLELHKSADFERYRPATVILST